MDVAAAATPSRAPAPRPPHAWRARQRGLEALGFRDAAFEVALGRRAAGRDEPAVEIDGDAVAFDASGVDQVVYRIAPESGRARTSARAHRVGRRAVPGRAGDQGGPRLRGSDADARLRRDRHGDRRSQRGSGGRSLWVLARDHQVLCVTHLPQIAAYADAHFQITKRERDGRTVTEVQRLDHEGRIVELAQMLGGAAGGPAAMASARELLDRADAWRQQASGAAG